MARALGRSQLYAIQTTSQAVYTDHGRVFGFVLNQIGFVIIMSIMQV